jgi:hypothetical protein
MITEEPPTTEEAPTITEEPPTTEEAPTITEEPQEPSDSSTDILGETATDIAQPEGPAESQEPPSPLESGEPSESFPPDDVLGGTAASIIESEDPAPQSPPASEISEQPASEIPQEQSPADNFLGSTAASILQPEDPFGATESLAEPDLDPTQLELPPEPIPPEPVTPVDPSLMPLADAGIDQVVEEGDLVTLDGGGSSDLDDNINSYLWTQEEGEPFVTLSDVDTPSPTFTSPLTVNGDTLLVFGLTVIDTDGLSDFDTVNVIVKDSNAGEEPIARSIVLEPVPQELATNQTYLYEGTLHVDGVNDQSGFVVEIRDDDGTDSGNLISIDDTDEGGKFSAEWVAIPKEDGYKIYASFEDETGTSLRSQLYNVRVSGEMPLLNETISREELNIKDQGSISLTMIGTETH